MYHIFVRCERFRGLRLEVPDSICKKVERQIVECKIKESLVEGLLKAAKLFFKDLTDMWPLHYSTLYLGHVPQLEKLVPVVAATRPLSRACFLYNVHLLERATAGAWQLRVQSSLFLCIHERHSVLITM